MLHCPGICRVLRLTIESVDGGRGAEVTAAIRKKQIKTRCSHALAILGNHETSMNTQRYVNANDLCGDVAGGANNVLFTIPSIDLISLSAYCSNTSEVTLN